MARIVIRGGVLLLLLALLPGCPLARDGAATARDFPRVRLEWPDGSGPARLAEPAPHRAIGYRHIPRDEAPPAIWFQYPEPRRVRFHMQGVAFPVRAYWLDADGCVLGWTDMRPETTGHGPPAPVMAVLEVPLTGSDGYRLERDDCVTLRR